MELTPAKKSLLVAIRDNKVDRLRNVLTKHASELSPNEEADSAKNRILHRAARYGHPEIVRVLLEEFGASPNETNKFGMTPLHHGSVAGNHEVVSALLRYGGNPNKADNSGRYPLHWAAAYSFPDVTKVLIEEGKAEVDCRDKDGFTPLHRCCQEKPESKEEEESAEGDPRDLHKEEDERRSHVARILLENGADLNAKESQGYQRPLHLCSMNGFARTAKVLLEDDRVDVNALNKIGITALMYACSGDHPETVAQLISNPNIDLTARDPFHNGWNALHKAILQDNVETVKLLYEAGVDMTARDGVGRSPAVLAEDHGKEKVVEYLKSLGY